MFYRYFYLSKSTGYGFDICSNIVFVCPLECSGTRFKQPETSKGAWAPALFPSCFSNVLFFFYKSIYSLYHYPPFLSLGFLPQQRTLKPWWKNICKRNCTHTQHACPRHFHYILPGAAPEYCCWVIYGRANPYSGGAQVSICNVITYTLHRPPWQWNTTREV